MLNCVKQSLNDVQGPCPKPYLQELGEFLRSRLAAFAKGKIYREMRTIPAEVCDLTAPIDRYCRDSDSVPIRGFPVCKMSRSSITNRCYYELPIEAQRRDRFRNWTARDEGGLPQTDGNLVS